MPTVPASGVIIEENFCFDLPTPEGFGRLSDGLWVDTHGFETTDRSMSAGSERG
jgi:hypothetical protein